MDCTRDTKLRPKSSWPKSIWTKSGWTNSSWPKSGWLKSGCQRERRGLERPDVRGMDGRNWRDRTLIWLKKQKSLRQMMVAYCRRNWEFDEFQEMIFPGLTCSVEYGSVGNVRLEVRLEVTFKAGESEIGVWRTACTPSVLPPSRPPTQQSRVPSSGSRLLFIRIKTIVTFTQESYKKKYSDRISLTKPRTLDQYNSFRTRPGIKMNTHT